jgi:hypothetical protein
MLFHKFHPGDNHGNHRLRCFNCVTPEGMLQIGFVGLSRMSEHRFCDRVKFRAVRVMITSMTHHASQPSEKNERPDMGNMDFRLSYQLDDQNTGGISHHSGFRDCARNLLPLGIRHDPIYGVEADIHSNVVH